MGIRYFGWPPTRVERPVPPPKFLWPGLSLGMNLLTHKPLDMYTQPLYTHPEVVHTVPRVDLRVTAAELADWRTKAGERGLSAWIREQCNGRIADNEAGLSDKGSGVHAVVAGVDRAIRPTRRRVAGDAKPAAEPIREDTVGGVATCIHDYGPKACPFPNCENYKWREG